MNYKIIKYKTLFKTTVDVKLLNLQHPVAASCAPVLMLAYKKKSLFQLGYFFIHLGKKKHNHKKFEF